MLQSFNCYLSTSLICLLESYKMLKISRILLLAVIAVNFLTNNAQQKNHLVIIPGQNEDGGANAPTILSGFTDQSSIHTTKTPQFFADFGQTRCMNDVKKTTSLLPKEDKIIIHASSQGTATALNYATQNPNHVSALVLEAVMLSGNSAIYHYTKNALLLRYLTYLPGSYYWLPYCAWQFPFYSPAGEQPINNIHRLPKNLPIIIYHCKQDPCLSFEDAQALYAFIKRSGRENVYFLPINTPGWGNHVELLQTGNVNINVINAIFAKYNLPHQIPSGPTLDPDSESFKNKYQPQPDQKWLDHFNDLSRKEKNLWYIDWCVKIIFYPLLACLLYRISGLNMILGQ